MKNLMLHRTKGATGPLAAKHFKIPGLSKSVGNYLRDKNLVQDPGFDVGVPPWSITGGWTIANSVANNDGAIGTLSQEINL